MADAPRPPQRGWPRAAGLFLLAWMAAPVVGGTILVAVVYLVMMLGLPVRRAGAYLVAAILAWAVWQGDHTGLWWTERGWAMLVGGWFVALTLRQPESGFLSRALGSLCGAGAVAVVVMLATGGAWGVVDYQMAERVHAYSADNMAQLRNVLAPQDVPPAILTALYSWAEWQITMFPATVALATLAALAVAWWLYVRLAHGEDQGLLPLREFRFNDQMIWLLIGGIALLLLGSEELQRAGWNAIWFMSALYALRGAAVVSFFGGGQSVVSALLLALGLIVLPPVVLMGALAIGLGDTWLDLRARARAAA